MVRMCPRKAEWDLGGVGSEIKKRPQNSVGEK